jgi:hypothetical protein
MIMKKLLAATALSVLAAGTAQAAAPAIGEGHLAVFDIDSDGAVSLAEYRITTSNVFILLDTDNDNMLTATEAGEIPEALFVAMDTDGDGMTSRAEYDVQMIADFEAADLDADGLLN